MKKTKKIVLSAAFTALGIVLLYLGALVDILDISTAVLASLLVLFFVAEVGYPYAFGIYLTVSVLSLLLLPMKTPAILFAGMFGYMPITKFLFEKKLKKLAWIPKIVLFNMLAVSIGYMGRNLLGFTLENQLGIPTGIMLTLYLVFGNLLFILCDVLYGRLLRFYFVRLHSRVIKYLK